ncbi:MAG: HAMP domain-containing histidine kinase [Bacteroidetes bacterium]|nr:HAMP domain-containing histidine kinase [Bacteroidota bacterium]
MSTALKTSFAPPERTPEHILLAQINKIESHSDITSVLHAIPEFVMILNKEREIVFANKSLLNYLAAEDDFLKRGFRPGEAINCQHAFENEAGCGTSEFCKTCGAVISILNSQSGQYEDVQECRIIQGDGCTALDLRVKSTRLSLEGEDFTVFTVADISNEKRRQALERIFFHDILNTAGGILGYTQILREAEPDELEIFSESIEELSNRLIEEIQAQKQLIAAEGGQLDIRPATFSSARMVHETIELYKNHVVAEGKSLVPGEVTDIEIVNDRSLLGRVLGNMVKNALEADPVGSVITVSCVEKEGKIIFSVNNHSFMPSIVQLQIFNRSFSSKGKGRGLGTYSMKLLSEKYLQGKVYFESSNEKGTTFYAEYPVSINQNE